MSCEGSSFYAFRCRHFRAYRPAIYLVVAASTFVLLYAGLTGDDRPCHTRIGAPGATPRKPRTDEGPRAGPLATPPAGPLGTRGEGLPPPVDLEAERRNGDCVRSMVAEGLVTAVHDVSDGGLLVALAEMALAGRLGAKLDKLTLDRPDLDAFLFGEDQARYIVTSSNSDPVVRALAAAKVPHSFLGSVGGDSIAIPNQQPLPLEQLRAAHEEFFPKLMGGSPTVA